MLRKSVRFLTRIHHDALISCAMRTPRIAVRRERAVYRVSHEGKTQAEAAQAAGVHRKRDRKMIHSLCLIFATFVLISLSVHRTCAGSAYEGMSWLTYRRGAPFISAPRNVRQPLAAPSHPHYINSMKTLYELERWACRWPVADVTLPGRRPGSQHLFCGEPAAPGKPYCRKHTARAFWRPGRDLLSAYNGVVTLAKNRRFPR
jgi:hypothetical protein